jgi:hypothetical protein
VVNKFLSQFENFSLLFALSANDSHKDVWYIDFSASRHMTPHKQLFATLKDRSRELVLPGDDRANDVKGIGIIPIRMPSKGIALIKDVLYVPDLKKNLFSTSVATDQDMDVKFSKSNCTVINLKDDKVFCNGVKDGGLYKLIVGIVDHKASMQDDESLVELCHGRFSHLNLDNLKKV